MNTFHVELSGLRRYGKGMFVTIHRSLAGPVAEKRKFHERITGRYYNQCSTQVKKSYVRYIHADGYYDNVRCWLCVGRSWLLGAVCHECNPGAETDEIAVKAITERRMSSGANKLLQEKWG